MSDETGSDPGGSSDLMNEIINTWCPTFVIEPSLSERRRKHREAALKAWETIRQNRKDQRVKGVEKLTNWISAQQIGAIPHPDIVDSKNISTWAGNGVIKLFNKTPEDIACGPFWEIRWAYGCPLNCSYCYLRGTMRGRMKPSYVRIEEIRRCLKEAFETIVEPQIFNSGELSDSLINISLTLSSLSWISTVRADNEKNGGVRWSTARPLPRPAPALSPSPCPRR
jgi:hypothetical protein